jgi:hypothetical protein
VKIRGEYLMDYIAFYNRSGKPIAWLSEDNYATVYLFSGEPVA